jgi:hypothetical protein
VTYATSEPSSLIFGSAPRKRIEEQDFVSKNHRLEKAGRETISQRRAGVGNIVLCSAKTRETEPSDPHLFVTLGLTCPDNLSFPA